MARRKTAKPTTAIVSAETPAVPADLVADVRQLILDSRVRAAAAVNSELVLLYWRIGSRIRTEVLKEQRAAYGEQIVATLSHQLTEQFGSGFARSNLTRMQHLAEAFPDLAGIVSLSRHLGWSHFVELLPISDARRGEAAESVVGVGASRVGVRSRRRSGRPRRRRRTRRRSGC